MGRFSWIHWLIVGLVILLLFGKGRFSEMMGDVAKGLKSFKKGMSEDEDAGRGAAAPDRRRAPGRGAPGRARPPSPPPPRRPRPTVPSSRPSRETLMFGIDSGELLIIAVVALVVIGPKDLPRVMRTVGQWVGRARGMARHFRSGVDTMIRESELEEMEKKWQADNERIMRDHPVRRARAGARGRLAGARRG